MRPLPLPSLFYRRLALWSGENPRGWMAYMLEDPESYERFTTRDVRIRDRLLRVTWGSRRTMWGEQWEVQTVRERL